MGDSVSCLPHLQLAIMMLLDRMGPLCGYRIRILLDKLGLEVDESAVYTALAKMKRRGLVEPRREVRNGRRVVRYTLTEKGKRELKRLTELFETISNVIRSIQAIKTIELYNG
jgi:DNA-binding PadR family transcriptional regulator